MVVGSAYSVHHVPIRLTYERLYHITENHPELAGRTYQLLETISNPEFVVKGKRGEQIAARKIDHRYLVVAYREEDNQGFIITSFLTSKIHQIQQRPRIWPTHN